MRALAATTILLEQRGVANIAQGGDSPITQRDSTKPREPSSDPASRGCVLPQEREKGRLPRRALFTTSALALGSSPRTGAMTGFVLASGLMLVPTPAQALICVSTNPALSGASDNGFTSATACGLNAAATGIFATATGAFSLAAGSFATATGHGSFAFGDDATATGQGANATGDFATATGQGSIANGEKATATGVLSTANGSTATAYGQGANATGEGTTAIGQGAKATADNSTALGVGASTAGFVSSTAIGAGAVNTAANQMMFGNDATTYAAPGITSAASLAAQTGPTKFVTSDAGGHLATSPFGPADIAGLASGIAGLNNSVANLNANVAGLWQNVGALRQGIQRGYEGTAIAIALAGAALPDNKTFAISGNFGTFRGQNAFGAQALVRVNEMLVLNGGIGVGFRQGGVGGRVGAMLAW
jgi:hypothetical protein